MSTRRVTRKLIAIHLALVAVSTAVILAFVYVSTRSVIEGEVREVVEAELRGMTDDYASGGVVGLARAIDRRLAQDQTNEAIYLLVDGRGNRIAGNLGSWPEAAPPDAGWLDLTLFRTDQQRAVEVSALAFRLRRGEGLLVGRDARARVFFDRSLLWALAWALGISAILALGSGWMLARYVDRRVKDVVDTANEIVEGDMSRRIPVRDTDDEFTRLARTLNLMLDRIEALVADLRMVTDSVAHDLRSPLTRIQSHLDASLDPDLPEPGRREAVERALGEAETVLRSFSALMAIARAEAGVGRDQFEPLDLSRLAADMADLYAPMAEDAGVALRCTGGAAPVQGHPQLLANAIANLVENALAHAPAGSEVMIETGASASDASITVADHGPGVPEAERARVLKRFTRLDQSRVRSEGGGGAGLGLSLVAAVARMHGADLSLAANDPGNDPGLRVSLRFPPPA